MDFMTDVETRAMQSNVFQLLGYIPVAENRQLYFASESARDSYFDGKVIAGNFTFKYMSFHIKVTSLLILYPESPLV